MTSAGQRPRVSPRLLTWTLCAALASASMLLALTSSHRSLLANDLRWAPLAITALFAGAEIAYVSVEFRRQTYSFTVAGIPLVLGLLSCPIWAVIAARVAGAAVVLVAQRLPSAKLAYNLAAFAFETALAGTLLHALGDGHTTLTLTGASTVYGTLLFVDLLMSSLLLSVIRIHGAAISRGDITATLLPAVAFNIVSLAYALVAVVLLEYGPLGWILLGALSAIAATAYRAHTVLAARHQSLAQVSEFVGENLGVENVEQLAGRRIARVRTLLRAASAQVILTGNDGDGDLVLSVDDADNVTVTTALTRESDWLAARVREHDEAVLLARGTKDPGLRRWLHSRGVRDAIMVPVSYGDELRGTLTVTGRLADHATFTPDDVTLLKTLAGHLGVALRSSRLLQRLRHDATHDVLTGLANRALLQETLDAALRHREHTMSVWLLDLDGFKEVNDALGHDVGDRLLQVVGDRLLAGVPAGATVARLGGDEFAILLCGPRPGSAPVDIVGLAQALATAVAVPVCFDEATLSVEASIGVASTADGSKPHDLLRHADTAMYAAKAAKSSVQRYTTELDRGRGERLALVADLRVALERDELAVLFQPKVDLRARRVCGAEALVRWHHPRLGLLSPDVFIPIAESTGLIEPLTHLVLATALSACRNWRDHRLDVAVAVNLSARVVNNPQLPATIAAALHQAGLPPQALILEITESSVMADADATVPILTELSRVGVVLSLDDFGTGYSSLAYLQRLPVQEVKIDKSFVTGLGTAADDHASEALIRSIVSLGESFHLRIVAEGVEDAATMERLAALGCDTVQGYYLGRPRPPAELFDVARTIASVDNFKGVRSQGPTGANAPTSSMPTQRVVALRRPRRAHSPDDSADGLRAADGLVYGECRD